MYSLAVLKLNTLVVNLCTVSNFKIVIKTFYCRPRGVCVGETVEHPPKSGIGEFLLNIMCMIFVRDHQVASVYLKILFMRWIDVVSGWFGFKVSKRPPGCCSNPIEDMGALIKRMLEDVYGMS